MTKRSPFMIISARTLAMTQPYRGQRKITAHAMRLQRIAQSAPAFQIPMRRCAARRDCRAFWSAVIRAIPILYPRRYGMKKISQAIRRIMRGTRFMQTDAGLLSIPHGTAEIAGRTDKKHRRENYLMFTLMQILNFSQ